MSPASHYSHSPPWRIIAAASAAIAIVFVLARGPLEPLENLTIDWRHRLRAPSDTPTAPVIVGIGDSSFTLNERAPVEVAREPLLAAMSQPWPWDRGVFAAAVRRLRAAGARAIVFDVVFAAPNPGDAEFAAALAEPGAPVALAAIFQEEHSAEGEGTVTFLEPTAPLLAAGHPRVGFANVAPDRDGVVRQAWLAASAASVLAGWATPSAADSPVPSLAAAATGDGAAPAGRPTRGHIDFRRATPERFPRVPIENLFLADRWNGPLLNRGELFRDRVVFIGPWSEIRFKDYHATPLGRIPGVELQAHIAASLLEGGLLRQSSDALTVVVIIVVAALVAAIGIALRRAALQVVALALVGIAWLALAGVAFARSGLILPVVAPLGVLLSSGAAGLTVRYAGEQRERRRVRRLLASYVSEQVANVVVRQPETFEAALRGQRRPVTVLFADIRDFTSFAERTTPEVFIAQLNEYLHCVVDCVLTSEGTLQKFIGDAVLAVWGDTHTTGERGDAVRAVSAALAIEQAVCDLNAAWRGRADRVPLRIGVGLHQGPAMVGNIGHPRRMEFAVLGDTVNLASRLEGANRFLGTTLLVGDTLQALAADAFRFAPVARVVVKGRRQPVAVFTPIGPLAQPSPGWLADYSAALALLEQGQFAAAATGFTALPADDVRFGPLFAAQARFARECAEVPPPDWDGTRRFDQK